jgi:hypothetical protein
MPDVILAEQGLSAGAQVETYGIVGEAPIRSWTVLREVSRAEYLAAHPSSTGRRWTETDRFYEAELR